jgi:hypothetical protein
VSLAIGQILQGTGSSGNTLRRRQFCFSFYDPLIFFAAKNKADVSCSVKKRKLAVSLPTEIVFPSPAVIHTRQGRPD